MDIEVIGEDKLKARKPYVCDMCGKEISVGESYIKTFCKDHDSGKTITNRLHERCEDLNFSGKPACRKGRGYG